jgi:peptidyl-prolyl cis-trans isomerase SurA
VITTQDLEARLNLVTATSGAPPDPEVRRRLTQQVLRGFIDEKLQLQEAKRLSLQVTEPEIDQALTVLAQRNRLDLESFKRAWPSAGSTSARCAPSSGARSPGPRSSTASCARRS